ncbi:MAG TPA: ECF transporter S component [Clostridiales bacterium]|nr:ECF transporter S component [Clostridiales bacterium]
MMSITRRTALGGLFIALSIILPQAVHIIGAADLGRMLLPMHIPVLLGGFILGPVFGLAVGAVSPVLSFLITQTPPVGRLVFMVFELAGYGFMSGLLYRTCKLYRRGFGELVSLLGAMVFGRLLYALALFVAADLIGVSQIGPAAVLEALAAGVIGVIVQIILIPALVFLLKKSRVLEGVYPIKGKNPPAGGMN